VGVRMKITES